MTGLPVFGSSGIKYDPTALGARCDVCYLNQNNEGGPVPPEINTRTWMTIVGEAPGGDEVKLMKPFVGRSGQELDTALGAASIRRQECNFVNSISCRPVGNKLDLAIHRWEKSNKQREAQGLPKTPSPMECCRPRFEAELAMLGEAGSNIIAVGRRACDAVLGKQSGSILAIRGGPITLETGVKVMPTLHPAFVLRQRRYTKAFRTDIGRAARWFRGVSGWREPKITYQPSPAQLRDFLSRHPAYSYDTETRSPDPARPELAKEPLMAKLAVIGFATDDEVMVCQIIGKDYVTRFYQPGDEFQIIEVIKTWALNPAIVKYDWNGPYDCTVMKWNWGFQPVNRVDGILIHRVIESELPHGLGFAASVHTEIPKAWKLEHGGSEPETDAKWCEYNGTDDILTYRIMDPMMKALRLRGQEDALKQFHGIQKYCVGMHEQGIWVNEFARQEWDVKLRVQAVTQLQGLRKALAECGLPEVEAQRFNPRSTAQLSALFFDRWKLEPVEFSEKTGEPSTGDDTIRELMRDKTAPEPRRRFLDQLRRFRATVLLRGTFVRRMIPFTERVPKDDYSYDEETEIDTIVQEKMRGKRAAKEEGAYGIVLADGRLHASWNSASVITGRVASSGPNCQNFSRPLRNIIAPWPGAALPGFRGAAPFVKVPDGIDPKNGKPKFKMVPADWLKTACGPGWDARDPIRVHVYADEDQLEMRIVAALAGIGRLLEAFEKKLDPHSINGESFFGGVFTKAKDAKGESMEAGKRFDRLRDFAKTGFYALCYNAVFETFYDTLTSAEDNQGNLLFVDFTQRQVRAIYDSYMRNTPEISRWWESTVAQYRRQGYLAEPVHNFRCDFLDGENADERTGKADKRQQNKIINWVPQACGHMVVSDAAIELTDGPGAIIPFGHYGHGTGLILDGHDRLDFEIPTFHPRRWMDPKSAAIGWCEEGCACPLEKLRIAVGEAMTRTGSRRIPGLPVDFTAQAKVVVGQWT